VAFLAPSPIETKLLDSVKKRVRLWNEVGPFYTDEKQGAPKSSESRGTEAVLNALILASYDSHDTSLSHDTRAAFNSMWAVQLKSGDASVAFNWLNFHLAPWAADDSQFYGAALAAIAVGTAPTEYRSTTDIQSDLGLLRHYLAAGYQKHLPSTA
jgi:squalene-hopene/tetraprenyl-beta-curcumene cyclase